MKKSEFMDELKEIFETDALSESQKLSELIEFDSLAIMSIAALVRAQFDINISGRTIKEAGTVGDLMDMIGSEKFE